MTRRHYLLSSIVLLLASANAALAVDAPTSDTEQLPHDALDLREPVRLDLSKFRTSSLDWVSAVTMTDIPPGSLHYEFAGLHDFVVRHARSQYRRFVRQASKRGWYVRTDNWDVTPLFDNQQERTFSGDFENGVWWHRSWLKSLPEAKGGAPEHPYIHTYGSDSSWSYGPMTVTNGMNARFDYIAFFELNPNPVEPQGDKPERRATLDIRPPHDRVMTTTDFDFDIKPRVRVGVPTSGDWRSILRELSLRGSVDVRRHGVTVVQGQIEAAWNPQGGLEVSFELSLISW
ncbi:MAG: hypothetical protein AB7L09_00830 [Nitrospira sp.]